MIAGVGQPRLGYVIGSAKGGIIGFQRNHCIECFKKMDAKEEELRLHTEEDKREVI